MFSNEDFLTVFFDNPIFELITTIVTNKRINERTETLRIYLNLVERNIEKRSESTYWSCLLM